jgi:esterase/lipase
MQNLRSLVVVAALALVAQASAQSRCQSELRRAARQENQRLDGLYREFSGGADGLRAGNGGRVRWGSNGEGILLVHGFISSPFEVDAFGEIFEDAGYTVYEPLIAGFGSSAHVANSVTRDDWRASFRNSLRKMTRCYSRVHVVGFSLGSTLALDLLTSDEASDRELASRVKSLSLLSPYVKAHMKSSRILNAFMRVFTSTVQLTKLFSLSGNQDLAIPMANPGYYNQAMPLKAVSQTLTLTKELRHNAKGKVFSLPSYMAYSHSDATVDGDTAIEFFSEHFSDGRGRIFSEDSAVPHQLGMSAVVPRVARDVLRMID